MSLVDARVTTPLSCQGWWGGIVRLQAVTSEELGTSHVLPRTILFVTFSTAFLRLLHVFLCPSFQVTTT